MKKRSESQRNLKSSKNCGRAAVGNSPLESKRVKSTRNYSKIEGSPDPTKF